MVKMRWMLAVSAIIIMVSTSLLPVDAHAAKILYVGGTQSLTGPFAEDSAAVLSAIQDYVKYVNETKIHGSVAKRKISRRYNPGGDVAG